MLLRIFIGDFIGVIWWDQFSLRKSERGEGGEGRHKKAIETSIVKFVARFRCSPFPTGGADSAQAQESRELFVVGS